MGIQSLHVTHMQEQQVSETSNPAKALGTEDDVAIQVYIPAFENHDYRSM